MFSYYGSKSQIVKHYPRPKHDRIIEPFAGSARYSLRYFDRAVKIVDKYDVVVKVWKFLQQCSPKDILQLPELKLGEDIRTFNLSEDETMFLGMMAGVSSISPRNKVSSFSALQNGSKNKMKIIANQLFKIKHWEIIHGSYEDIENENATWFIDAPYQVGGMGYKENKIDFNLLASWSRSRDGQVIVCENTKANWMDFIPLVNIHGAMSDTTEAIWTNQKTSKVMRQQIIF